MYEKDPIKIFVVEDDQTYTRFLKYVLSLNPDFEVEYFTSGKEFIGALHHRPAIVTLDYSLPDMSGEEVLKEIKAFDPNISVIIVSAQEKIGTAVGLLKAGAFDYITKDEEAKDRILNSINNARNKSSLIREIDRLKEEINTKYEFGKSIIGNSPAIKKVFGLIEKSLKTNITVSITGETGTGKELVAKAIHYNSARKQKPLVAVNIAAIPKELIESELFGHEKGAFTGASTRRIGKFEEAKGGTLFLDEIGEMDLNLQSKLLRVLQERELSRVGGNEVIKIDVRIIVATHRNLQEEVQAGNFREDLFYRLLGLPIQLPSLRDRGNDVILLAKYFLDEFARENKFRKFKIAPEAQGKLLQYPFPGNIRELKSVIELAAVMAENGQVNAEDITFANAPRDSFILKEMKLKDYVYHIIRDYLNKYDNNVMEVAKRLGIGKSSIYRYMKEMEEAGIQ
ncbi:MAG TPA: sigma-54 dependent transcriptional regulator [Cyclobacteriaceae bacterium]|nr:sigma-54-dependent Fis family transcriptional regulator [Cyclobacteriaceae bacterium]MCB9239274.1 sigma-54-dependent Fis family transcriptional regulator [Flammeovirgaceae bacterium]MCB0500519.1 sigma-54-dependent Fis family transcriptional regulator [Cyclobacteriaceae bacterium]MCO5272400.1 sigma-54 dependent transcriptional regulator [Cyclobacteriaceae bacterium]MCW5903293.1 sigma-54-dependent Fis family transcriptional regulator [Cyclobacteriaceae bacterium]